MIGLSWTAGSAPADVPPSDDPPQFPLLFAPYPIRPPGIVPGVDVKAGVLSSTILRPANTVTLPSGVSRDTTKRLLTVTSADVVLDAIDFSVNGGYGVIFKAPRGTVSNSLFTGQSANGDVQIRFGDDVGQAANDGSVIQCTVDSTGINISTGQVGIISQDTRYSGMTVKRCHLKNGPSDALAMGGGAVVFWDNFIENLGTDGPLGAHPDIVQINSSGTFANTFDIRRNCAYSNAPAVANAGIQGYMMDSNTGPAVAGGIIDSNVIIGPANSNFIGNGGPPSQVVMHSNNYFHPTTGDVGWARGGTASSLVVYTNNWNLRTGALEPTNP